MPGLDGEMVVSTWPSGSDGLFAVRDFMVSDGNSRLVARAKSYWLVVDSQTKRPQRLAVLPVFPPVFNHPETMDKKLNKLDFHIDKIPAGYFKVNFSDMDIARHVNNTRYIDWIIDDFDAPFRASHFLNEIEIDFLLETSAGDHLAVCTDMAVRDSLQFRHHIKKEDGREVCRAVTKFLEIEKTHTA